MKFRYSVSLVSVVVLSACGESETVSPDLDGSVGFDASDAGGDSVAVDVSAGDSSSTDVAGDAVDAGVDGHSDVAPADVETDIRRDTGADDVASDDAELDASDSDIDDDTGPIGLLPIFTTTDDGSFDGVIPPGQTQFVYMAAAAGDTVVLTLSQTGDGAWGPQLRLLKPDGGTLAGQADPPGFDDIRLPGRGTGIVLDASGDWVVELINPSASDGDYRFAIDCAGGPCSGAILVDDDADGIDDSGDNCLGLYNPPQDDVDNDLVGDACDDALWADLSGADLRAVIRAEHAAHHRSVGYSAARVLIFGEVDNVSGRVEDVYTGRVIETTVPPDSTDMNVEHTWPQSRGADTEPARSDLHHLFPVDASANSSRGNLEFCEVVGAITFDEGGSLRGEDAAGRDCFEPRTEHKGNAARAMFYFAVVYNYAITAVEEPVLRAWMTQDPVDEHEIFRNTEVQQYQRFRNPFIDDPTLVDRISDF